MAEAVYILCAITSLACASLLTRASLRIRSNLVLWSAVCFAALAANSVLVVVDQMVLPQYDLRPLRLGVAVIGLLVLVAALIRESDKDTSP
jgi:hypothetical protein